MSWLLELFAHFRLQYLVLLVALAAIFVVRRRRYTALSLLPFAIINAIAVAPYWPRGVARELVEPSFELMTVNLNGRNDDYGRFIELARRVSPDLIVLLEVDSAWAHALEDLAEDYPQRVLLPREGPFGIAVLSRLPLLEHRAIDLYGTPAVEARIALPDGRALRLVGVHLRSPTSPERAAQRNAQLAALRPLVAAHAGPLIVAGDFNVTPYSPIMSDWLEQTGLEDPRRRHGFGMTWPTFMPLLGVPIDHCLLSGHFVVAEQYQGPAFGSDHYPVITRIGLRGNE
jgi:endonuclease/exonuclease/phosphatase (EEP) superfamily protein YafD